MTWWQIIWSLLPWWGWVGIFMMVMTTLGALAWFWLNLTCSAFSGRGFWLVLTFAIIGSILTFVGVQHQDVEPLRLQLYRPPAPMVQPKQAKRVGLL